MPTTSFTFAASGFVTAGYVQQQSFSSGTDLVLYLHAFGANAVGKVRGSSATIRLRGANTVRVYVDDVFVQSITATASYVDTEISLGTDDWHNLRIQNNSTVGPYLSRDVFLQVTGASPACAAPDEWGTSYLVGVDPFLSACQKHGFVVKPDNFDHAAAYPYVRTNIIESFVKFRASALKIWIRTEFYRNTVILLKNGVEVFRIVHPTSNSDPWGWLLVADNGADSTTADYEIRMVANVQGGYMTMPEIRLYGGTGLVTGVTWPSLPSTVLGVLGTSISSTSGGSGTGELAYVKKAATALGMLLQNRAEPGATSANIATWVGDPVANNGYPKLFASTLLCPDLVLVEVGANDGSTAEATFEANVTSILNQCITALDSGGKTTAPIYLYCMRRNNWSQALSDQIQQSLVDSRAACSSPSRVAVIPAAATTDWFDWTPGTDSTDGVHPNPGVVAPSPSGHEKLSIRIQELLLPPAGAISPASPSAGTINIASAQPASGGFGAYTYTAEYRLVGAGSWSTAAMAGQAGSLTSLTDGVYEVRRRVTDAMGRTNVTAAATVTVGAGGGIAGDLDAGPNVPAGGSINDEEALVRIGFVRAAPSTNHLINRAPKGKVIVDLTNARMYINAGTRAAPSWKQITRAA